ncbi:MAG: hypothetical protein A3G24_07665 [Betaproteobacteria bacterium RIFCSPLOWO2_12_FULL_62_13]|nr:MAG: hypothetical protein A3G24_07665 [Betaproteobacteria bacterium RIFCSPLOWO2_12_FULL_62_13]
MLFTTRKVCNGTSHRISCNMPSRWTARRRTLAHLLLEFDDNIIKIHSRFQCRKSLIFHKGY